MEWKKIAKVLLRILWMMAPPWSVEGSKSSKGLKVVPKGHVQEKQKVVSPNKKEEATNESNPLLPQDATNGSNPSNPSNPSEGDNTSDPNQPSEGGVENGDEVAF